MASRAKEKQGGVIGVSDVALLGGQLYATVDGGDTVHGNPE
jgi:hypothetical protein